ncbi:MAG: lactate racemase domain-containing protein [Planctomycetota bacterium]
MSGLLDALRETCGAVRWQGAAPTALAALDDDGFPREALRRFLRQGQRPLLLVNDAARVIHCGLPQLLHELRGGCPTLEVLVATGTHTADAAAEAARLGCEVQVHDAQDEPAHVEVGAFRVDARLLQASAVVAFGSVEPHYFAGWTGAHKTASVGVWDWATTAANHRHAMQPEARPLVASDQNPVAAGIRQGVRACMAQGPPLLAVNHVLDAHGVPLAVGWGDPFEALGAVLPQAEARGAHTCASPVDVVVARVEGPLGRSLYQADKGIKNHEGVLKDGGLLVLEAELSDGVGQDRFLRLLEQAPDAEAARARITAEGYRLGDHKALRWRLLEARGVRIVIASPQLDPEAVRAAGIEVAPSVEAALAGAEFPLDAIGLAVEDAGFVASRVVTG